MDVTIRPLRDDEDTAAFRALNEEWITQYFAMEAEDQRQLATRSAPTSSLAARS